MAERSQLAQQSFGEFLGNVQRQWNQPKALKASFDAFTTRGPPAAEVAAATAVSSFQVSCLGTGFDNMAGLVSSRSAAARSRRSWTQCYDHWACSEWQVPDRSQVLVWGAGSLSGWLDGILCQGASRCHGSDDPGWRKSRYVRLQAGSDTSCSLTKASTAAASRLGNKAMAHTSSSVAEADQLSPQSCPAWQLQPLYCMAPCSASPMVTAHWNARLSQMH